jgi:preprotein translocase subunit YajC
MTDFLMQYGEIFSIIMFFIPPILSVIILYFTKRNWIWLSIPITIVVDLLIWGKGIFESSHSGIALAFLIPQVTVVAIISFVILYIKRRRKKHNL